MSSTATTGFQYAGFSIPPRSCINCKTQFGSWVYKTPEQWEKENPGVLETLVHNQDGCNGAFAPCVSANYFCFYKEVA